MTYEEFKTDMINVRGDVIVSSPVNEVFKLVSGIEFVNSEASINLLSEMVVVIRSIYVNCKDADVLISEEHDKFLRGMNEDLLWIQIYILQGDDQTLIASRIESMVNRQFKFCRVHGHDWLYKYAYKCAFGPNVAVVQSA